MPGPKDQIADQVRPPEPGAPEAGPRPRPERGPDSVHAHEGQADRVGLRERLERLPPGHPSSPYSDDGSRKSPLPDLAGRELPLPGEPRPDRPDPDTERESARRAEGGGGGVFADTEGGRGLSEQDRTRPGEDQARIGEDGSWDWKGRHLTPEQSHIADETLARCLAAEGRDSDGNYADRGLTPAMRRIEAQLEHGHLVDRTEEFALKSPDRFKEKLAEMISAEPDKSPREHASEIHDGVRYTFVFYPDQYSSSVKDVIDRIIDDSFELGVRKNTWQHDEYKGINTRWLDHGSGLRFEIQFHTQESWDAKQATHEAYEKINDTRTATHERESLRKHQREVCSRITIPIGSEKIHYYRRQGW